MMLGLDQKHFHLQYPDDSRNCSRFMPRTRNGGTSRAESNDNLAAFQFEKFAAAYFQMQNSAYHTRKQLPTALLLHDSDLDCAVSQPDCSFCST